MEVIRKYIPTLSLIVVQTFEKRHVTGTRDELRERISASTEIKTHESTQGSVMLVVVV